MCHLGLRLNQSVVSTGSSQQSLRHSAWIHQLHRVFAGVTAMSLGISGLLPVSDGIYLHQQKIVPSRRNGSIGVKTVRQSRQRHPSGGLLRTRRQFNGSHSISPSNCCFTSSSRPVGLLFQMITLALWPTVTIRRNGFTCYALALELECNGWCCENLSSRSFYLRAKCNTLFTKYTGLQGDGWHRENLSSRSFYLRAKCTSLFTNYTHHSKSPDQCGYWKSIACSIRLRSYH